MVSHHTDASVAELEYIPYPGTLWWYGVTRRSGPEEEDGVYWVSGQPNRSLSQREKKRFVTEY